MVFAALGRTAFLRRRTPVPFPVEARTCCTTARFEPLVACGSKLRRRGASAAASGTWPLKASLHLDFDDRASIDTPVMVFARRADPKTEAFVLTKDRLERRCGPKHELAVIGRPRLLEERLDEPPPDPLPPVRAFHRVKPKLPDFRIRRPAKHDAADEIRARRILSVHGLRDEKRFAGAFRLRFEVERNLFRIGGEAFAPSVLLCIKPSLQVRRIGGFTRARFAYDAVHGMSPQ